MFWWRAIFTDGKCECYIESIFAFYRIEDAETNAREIDNSIGMEDYARGKGLDLTKWKLTGVFIVTTRNQ